MSQNTKQMGKARLGAIGENNVVSILMQKGWDAFNANCTIKNYKSIDIVCLNNEHPESEDKPWKPTTALVQVKTCTQTNIPVGFNIGQASGYDENGRNIGKEYLREYVKGPYVFVYAKEEGGELRFRYFILSRSQFIELVYAAHRWYTGWPRDKELNMKSPAGLYVRWLEGKSDAATDRHEAFLNPLNGVSCENCWENIWKD